MYKRIFTVILVGGWLLPVYAQAETTVEDYVAAHEAALETHEKVVERKHQWTTTIDVLQASEEAAEAGNFEEAEALSIKAKKLAKQALKQAKDEKDLWRTRVPQ